MERRRLLLRLFFLYLGIEVIVAIEIIETIRDKE